MRDESETLFLGGVKNEEDNVFEKKRVRLSFLEE